MKNKFFPITVLLATLVVVFPPSADAQIRSDAVVGFETAEGFSEGFIGGQAGWAAWDANTSQPIISTNNPATGSQHLRIENHPGIPAGEIVAAISPDFGPNSATAVSEVMVKIYISATGGSYYTIRALDLAIDTFTWEFTFDDGDRMFVLDDFGSGTQLVAVPDTFLWTPASYHDLHVVTDPVAGTIQYFLDSTLVYSGNTIGGNTIDQIVLISDNYVGSHADIDDLSINSGSGAIFEDGFESTDTSHWDQTYP